LRYLFVGKTLKGYSIIFVCSINTLSNSIISDQAEVRAEISCLLDQYRQNSQTRNDCNGCYQRLRGSVYRKYTGDAVRDFS